MGLDTTHECWHGSYSNFMAWRREIASHININLDDMTGFGGDTEWETLPQDPLHFLLHHSDCDGLLAWEVTKPIADRLQAILPLIDKSPSDSYFYDKTLQFITGLRCAHDLHEDVYFH